MKPGSFKVKVGNFDVGGDRLTVIGGPCVIEDVDTCLEVAGHLKAVTAELGLNYIFKSSFEKDNRSSASGFKGPGLEDGLQILAEVKARIGVPVLSDVHCREQVDRAAEVLDVIQIPAYLSQQTELALVIGRTGRVVNVKKGQFLAPEDMKAVVSKIRSTGNTAVILTERGSCFGYRRLVVDMRALPIMRSLDCPVIFDVTHAVRIYGYPSSDPAGGEPQYVPYLARAAVACGVDGLFLETHPEPKRAMCDSSSMLPLSRVHWLLSQVAALDRLVRTFE
ncbi:MAG: 3-deoxy-8-phosphooctulonate synthase [Candidatus Eisenbacteria bacterium]